MKSLKNLFKKRTKRVYQSPIKGRKTPNTKKVYSKPRKKLKRKNSYSFPLSIYTSIIISSGLIILSLTIFFLVRQLQPMIKNEKLKFLCTYELGDKKNQNYRDAKVELDKLVGDSDKYCKNFLLPKEKKGFRFFPIMKNILFRFI